MYINETCKDNEIWKDVVGYEGIYEVSNTGRVRSKDGKVTYSKLHGKRKWKGRILKEKNPTGRDVRVSLWKDNKERSWLVHQLVAKAFILNPKGFNQINHIDGNPRNNHVNNLEWTNYTLNNNHAFDNDLIGTNKRVVLRNLKSGELLEFRSMSKTDEYLGKYNGFVSSALREKKPIDGYYLYTREL